MEKRATESKPQLSASLNKLRILILRLWRLLTRTATVVTIKDSRFEVDSTCSLDLELERTGDFEDDLNVVLGLSLKLEPKGTFIDVGGNAGYWSVPMARVFQSVFSFEPDPAMLRRLERNIRLNALENVQISRLAISNRSGEALFNVRMSLDNSGAVNNGLGSLVKADSMTQDKIAVKTASLDGLFAEDRMKITLIKIDVEGAEELVLEGSAWILSTNRPVVISEVLFSDEQSKSETFESRIKLFPSNYRHFVWRESRFISLDVTNLEHLSNFNMFSVPDESVFLLEALESSGEMLD